MYSTTSDGVGVPSTIKEHNSSLTVSQAPSNARIPAAITTRGTARMPVEHVKIGSYRFPLYSHPLFRVRLAEDAYVEKKVRACLDDPSLYAAMTDMVEMLLAQGSAGASMEDVQQLLEAHLRDLDGYWLNEPHNTVNATATGTTAAAEAAPISPAPQRVGAEEDATQGTALPALVPTATSASRRGLARGQPGATTTPASQPPPHYEPAENASVRRGRFQSSTRDALAPSTHAHVSPLAASQSHAAGSSVYVSSVDAPDAQTATETRNYITLPSVSPAVLSVQNYLAQPSTQWSSPIETTKQGSATTASRTERNTTPVTAKKAGRDGSVRLDSTAARSEAATLPHWRGAWRDAVYSLIHIRLQESVEANSEEAESSRGRQEAMLRAIVEARERQRALDGATLASMSQPSYAALDVVLDGNTTCLSRRTQGGHGDARVKIMANSRALCAQKQQLQNLRTVPKAPKGSAAVSSKVVAQSTKARRVAEQHRRLHAQEQIRRQNEEEQELRRRQGLDTSPAWW